MRPLEELENSGSEPEDILDGFRGPENENEELLRVLTPNPRSIEQDLSFLDASCPESSDSESQSINQLQHRSLTVFPAKNGPFLPRPPATERPERASFGCLIASSSSVPEVKPAARVLRRIKSGSFVRSTLLGREDHSSVHVPY